MMRLARKTMPKVEIEAWVYAELDRRHAPLENTPMAHSTPVGDGQIQGLSALSEDWLELRANASLSAEIRWLQANRHRIVEERPGAATLVRLDLALSPAPSWAALGWLETSIRSYANFVEVAAKVSGSDDGEVEVWRRELIAIEEVERLMGEMMEDVAETASGGSAT